MKTKTTSVLLVTLLIAACASQTPYLAPATMPPDSPATSVPTVVPALDFSSAEMTGRGFLEAWEDEDYARMYSLLAPDLRAGLAEDNFQQAYQVPLGVTTTISVTTLPTKLGIENDVAWIEFTVVWHTGLFGELRANNTLDLSWVADRWWVNWSRGAIWPDLGAGYSFGVEYQIPSRANIYDRDGAGLALPAAIITVGVIPGQIEDEPALLEALSLALNMAPEEIRGEYAGQPATWYIPIADITAEVQQAYAQQLSLPGVELRESTGRLYPMDGTGAHVVGWVSPIPAEDYQTYRQRGYRGDERVGVAGLEAWGEATLAGRNGGRLYLIDAEGEFAGTLAQRQPERGRAIYTTLDRNLQAAAEAVLGDRRGAVVALAVNSGEILALASGPRFDSNIFVRSTDEWERAAVLNDPNSPLLNRALQGLYPTGSVFKIVTLSAALAAGGMSPDLTFTCPGYWDGLGEVNRKLCWLETGHGVITLKDGLTASCNVVYYEVGKQLSAIDDSILPTFGKAFGLGQKTGLTELAEAEGLMPDPMWKVSTYQESWSVGDSVNLAIGQGYLLVTPLQVAHMVAAVANGGTLYRPHLVLRIAESPTTPETAFGSEATGLLPVSAEQLAIVREAMKGVTADIALGTAAHRFAGLGIPVAGKTGSAEPARDTDLPHAWFAGYWPADDPHIAMVVLAENAGEGSTVAAPMFRQILEIYYGLSVTPLPTPEATPTGD